jgi:predicted nucleic acid-binding protein
VGQLNRSRLYLLDTGVLGALAYGGILAERIDHATGVRASDQRPLISVVTHGELRTFIRGNQWGEKRQAGALAWLDHLVTVDLGAPELHDAYADMKLYTKKKGAGLGDNDLWIAATTKVANATLLTTDKDFEPLSEIWIERMYFAPTVINT